MEISVVVTTYKRPTLAKRAIKSTANQTYTPAEIIVIEDASVSGIDQWIERYYPNIRYIKNNRNLGLAGSRNKGIELATSNWIAFLDDDDEWMPNRLEEQVNCYKKLNPEEKKQLACIQCGVKNINTDGKLTGIHLPVNDGNLKESIKKHGASTPSSSFLFFREALENVGGFDESLVSGIDHDIWMKLAVAGYSTKSLREPLVIVHQEPITTMMTNTEKRIKGITQYIEKWEPTYVEWFGETEGSKYAKEYYVNIIGRLAGIQLANNHFQQFYSAFKSVGSIVGLDFFLFLKFNVIILKTYLVSKFSFIHSFVKIRKIKRINY